MEIKYRIGVMPGPWRPGRDGADFLWTPCPISCPSDRMLEQLAILAEQVVPEYHSR